MRYRSAAALGLVLALARVGAAQSTGFVVPRPPDRAALERLNLRTEWAIDLPLDAGRDSVALVQTLGDQVFVQTRRGVLSAVDAADGRVQWTAPLGNGAFTPTHPVAVNSRYAFAVNVTTLHAFHRYTGQREFTFDLDTLPTAGLTADEDTVYAVLAIRPGFGGSSRLEAFRLPRPIPVFDPAAAPPKGNGVGMEAAAAPSGSAVPNPVDTLIRRYPSANIARNRNDDEDPEPAVRRDTRSVPSGGYGGSRTPSLVVVPTLSPPFSLESGARTPSLVLVPSLRQPYRSRTQDSRNVQQTPSLSVLPPSVAAALALTDLRPTGLRPLKVLELGLTSRVLYPLLLTPLRVWGATDSDELVAYSKLVRTREVVSRTSDRVSAAPAQADDLGYFPLADGNLLAVDLTRGNTVGGASVLWRATVGGLMDRPPLVSRTAVYASGENSGVARIDRKDGTVLWRSDSGADRLLAANDDFAYVRDHLGRLLVYDARAVVDPAVRTVQPLALLSLPAFNVPVANTVTDRLYLVADNGLIVCVRDAAAKYARPVRMAPPAALPGASNNAPVVVPPAPGDSPKVPAEPKVP